MELANYLEPTSSLALDFDLAFSQARFRDVAPDQDYNPGRARERDFRRRDPAVGRTVLIAIVAASVERGRARGQVPADVDAEDTARLFVGNAHMAAVMKFSPDSRLDLEGHVRQAVMTLLAG
mgnify:CR=1 FL=1